MKKIKEHFADLPDDIEAKPQNGDLSDRRRIERKEMRRKKLTAIEWFQTLPADICAMAIRNTEAQHSGLDMLDVEHETLKQALAMSFIWAAPNSPEGTMFWGRVYDGDVSEPNIAAERSEL